MTNNMSLRVNIPFIKYVAEKEQNKMSNPIEPKRSIFERIDEGIGLNKLKRNVKKYTGITYLSNIVTKMVDDGDDNNLSRKERLWEGVKGCGKAIDNFIGSQGLAFMGMLALGSYAAGLAGIGRLFNIATKSYFLFQGSKLAIKGTKEFVKADTKEDAKEGATTAATGGIMLFGTVKSIVKDVKAYNTAKTNFRTSVETSRAKLEIPDGEVLTEVSLKKAYRQAAIKNHPDKGGSEAAMAEVTAAFEFLSKNMKSASKIRTSAVPAPSAETVVKTSTAQTNKTANLSGERGIVLASQNQNNLAKSVNVITTWGELFNTIENNAREHFKQAKITAENEYAKLKSVAEADFKAQKQSAFDIYQQEYNKIYQDIKAKYPKEAERIKNAEDIINKVRNEKRADAYSIWNNKREKADSEWNSRHKKASEIWNNKRNKALEIYNNATNEAYKEYQRIYKESENLPLEQRTLVRNQAEMKKQETCRLAEEEKANKYTEYDKDKETAYRQADEERANKYAEYDKAKETAYRQADEEYNKFNAQLNQIKQNRDSKIAEAQKKYSAAVDKAKNARKAKIREEEQRQKLILSQIEENGRSGELATPITPTEAEKYIKQ